MKKIYLIFALFFGLSFNMTAQETVIGVWDFVGGSTTGVIGEGFTTAGTNDVLGWLKNGDQTSATDVNSVVQSGRGITGNGFSGSFLNGLDITSADLVDGKLHVSITYNNIDLTGTGTVQQLFLKGAGNSNFGTNHRMVGLKLSHDATNSDIKVESIVLNNGIQYGGSKDQGGLGTSAVYSEQITLGTTMDFVNMTSTFWVGSPGEFSTNPYGLTSATNDINQSTSWNAATQTMSPNAMLKFLQFCSKNGDGSVEIDQFKISTGTYENTVASGDGETTTPESGLALQGIIDFKGSTGTNGKAIHLLATADVPDLSVYAFAISSNGNNDLSADYTLPSGSASAGDHILLARDAAYMDEYMAASTIFSSVIEAGSSVSQNGDDPIALLLNDVVVEQFQDPSTDGTGTDWEYSDSWAYKVNGAWTYGGVQCTSPATPTTWDSDCVYPFAVGQQPASFTAPSWAGNWLIDPAAGALAVGPSQGSGQWYASNENTATERACLYDDVYTFGDDGSFTNTLQDQTWIESWQSGVDDACGTPVAPHDGSNAATYTYDETTVTLNGLGAYLGLAKAFNLGELSNPADAVSTITYLITEVNENYLTLDIEVGNGNWWRFRLIKEGYTPPPPATYNVTFNVDMNNSIVPDAGVYAGGGILGDATAYQMTDADGDGIWTVTIEMLEGTTGDYIFLNGPGDGGDWGRKEQLAGQDCGQGQYNDRLLPPVTADATYSFCFGTCEADCGVVTRYDVTFNVDTNNIEVGANGMTIGGGIMGGANAFAMTDADGDGVYTRTVSMPAGTTGNYVFLNNTSNHYAYDGKEDLNGQDCADGQFNDRLLAAVTEDTSVSYCFATCEVSCTTAGLDDLGITEFTYFPNPVNDMLTINAQSNIKDITVYNMLGQIVVRQSPNASNCTVDMSTIQTGAYFVQVSIGNSIETVRVLKK